MFLNAYLYVDFVLYSRPYHLQKTLVLTYLREKTYNSVIFFFDQSAKAIN